MIVLYLIDARTILHPRDEYNTNEDVDWSCLGLFDQDKSLSEPSSSQRNAHQAGLDITEIGTVSCMAQQVSVKLMCRYVASPRGPTSFRSCLIPMV
jgi:hypothetical protein